MKKCNYDYSSLSKQYLKYGDVMYLMSHINEHSLLCMHYQLTETKMYGIDEVSRKIYGLNLTNNIKRLYASMKSSVYKPLPVKRLHIPKPNGKLRPIGIPAYEDKLVQGVMASILNAIYENVFLNCSYGFRSHRNCHLALKDLNKTILNNDVNYIVEADIKSFFDNVNHNELLKFIKEIIKDKKFIQYIEKFLKAGVIEDAKHLRTKRGTPQGGLISPVLANIFLHYVLDKWFENYIRPKCNYCHLIRYADDFIVCFKSYKDACWFQNELKNRFKEYHLELESSKTKIIIFEKYSNLAQTFDFLGFTISTNNNKEQFNINYTISIKSLNKEKKSIKYKIKKYCRKHRLVYYKDFYKLIKYLNIILSGIYKYFNTYTSQPYLDDIYNYAILQLKNCLTKKQFRRIKQLIGTIPIVEPSTSKTIKL